VRPGSVGNDDARSSRLYDGPSGIRLHVTTLRRRTLADSGKSKSSREKVRRYRDRLRQRGLQPIQIWVPDVRSASFLAQAYHQSLAVAQSEREGEDQGFIDGISELDDE